MSLGIVLYTDGGCLDNGKTGAVGGYGIHGYSYTTEKANKGSGCKRAKVTSNGYVVDAEEDVSPIEYYNIFGSLNNATNNIAELVAAIEAFKLLETLEEPIDVLLLIDSKYVIMGLTEWMSGWIKRNWVNSKGAPVENRTYWETLNQLKTDCKHNVTIKHVKGHSGNLGNDLADELATSGMVAFNSSGVEKAFISKTPSTGYWNTSKSEITRLMDQRNWYFNLAQDIVKSKDGYNTLCCGEHGPLDEMIAKPDSNTTLSVIRLKEVPPLLVALKEKTRLLYEGHSRIGYIRIDTLSTGNVYETIEQRGIDIVCPTRDNKGLITAMQDQLAVVFDPPWRSLELTDAFINLENILDFYKAGVNTITENDITELLYSKGKTAKQTKLKPLLGVGTKSFEVDVNYSIGDSLLSTKVTLTVGIDTPKRNTLSAVAGLNPVVKILTWSDSKDPSKVHSVNIGTYVECDEGYGIWIGGFSNLRVIIPSVK